MRQSAPMCLSVMKWPEIMESSRPRSDDFGWDKGRDPDSESQFISFFASDEISVIWSNWTAITGSSWGRLTAANRNPIHSTLSAVLNSLSLGVELDDRNNLAPARLTVHFRNQYLQFTSFKVHSGRRFHIIPFQISWSYLAWALEWVSPKCEFFGKNQCRHCAL